VNIFFPPIALIALIASAFKWERTFFYLSILMLFQPILYGHVLGVSYQFASYVIIFIGGSYLTGCLYKQLKKNYALFFFLFYLLFAGMFSESVISHYKNLSSLILMVLASQRLAQLAISIGIANIKNATIYYFLAGLFFMLYSILNFKDIGSTERMQDVFNAVGLGYMAVPLILCLCLIALYDGNYINKIICLFVAIIPVSALLLTQSRGPFSVLIILLLLVIIQYIVNQKTLKGVLFFGASGSLIIYLFLNYFSADIFSFERLLMISSSEYQVSRNILALDLRSEYAETLFSFLFGFGYGYNGVLSELVGKYGFEQIQYIIFFDIGIIGSLIYIIFMLWGVYIFVAKVININKISLADIGLSYIYFIPLVVIISSPFSFGLFYPSGTFLIFLSIVYYLTMQDNLLKNEKYTT
jgi:hypothetical protein